ncbi:hypothetical protein TcWFU_010465 [Taenia crassiceps]|uniref:Uncharacterized protein n=1 Tax=Taenia crassiceps TaxID=6207 RepID=A0ABR4QNR6_9CEST
MLSSMHLQCTPHAHRLLRCGMLQHAGQHTMWRYARQDVRSPSGGLEPPTFRLTAERANPLRHEGRLVWPRAPPPHPNQLCTTALLPPPRNRSTCLTIATTLLLACLLAGVSQ